jgi:hypothetical protein
MLKNIKKLFSFKKELTTKQTENEQGNRQMVQVAHPPTILSATAYDAIDQQKFYIDVPYVDKEHVKGLGARWDSAEKSWFIPAGVNVRLFEKWILANDTSEADINVRSRGFYIMKSSRVCWQCDKVTSIFCFLLPANHQVKCYDDDERPYWFSCNESTKLSNIRILNKKAIEKMSTLTKHYTLEFSRQAGVGYYMNHCEICASKLGDFYTHDSPGGGFWLMTKENAEEKGLHWFDDHFSGFGAYSDGENLHQYMYDVEEKRSIIEEAFFKEDK